MRRCRFAGEKDAWYLRLGDDNSEKIICEAVKSALNAPQGGSALAKDGSCIEPELGPSIDITQDPMAIGGELYVKGVAPAISADSTRYEQRNRIVLQMR